MSPKEVIAQWFLRVTGAVGVLTGLYIVALSLWVPQAMMQAYGSCIENQGLLILAPFFGCVATGILFLVIGHDMFRRA